MKKRYEVTYNKSEETGHYEKKGTEKQPQQQTSRHAEFWILKLFAEIWVIGGKTTSYEAIWPTKFKPPYYTRQYPSSAVSVQLIRLLTLYLVRSFVRLWMCIMKQKRGGKMFNFSSCQLLDISHHHMLKLFS